MTRQIMVETVVYTIHNKVSIAFWSRQMLDGLYEFHLELMTHIPLGNKRYLYSQLNWDSRVICLIGDRGVGKSTLICQRMIEHYEKMSRGLYISADNINVLANGLLNIAKTYFAQGGEALFIDEVHKYPNWALEIKNIIDIYKDRHIIFTSSSSVDLVKSKADLSRRVVYYRLNGLSFREYLQFVLDKPLSVITLQDIIKNHVDLVQEMKLQTVLKHFQDYLRHGFYPFFMEGVDDYLGKLNNILEKVIYEDIGVIYSLKTASLVALKKMLWLIATAGCFIPNIDNMSKDLQLSRDFVYDGLEYLQRAGLISSIYANGKGMKLVRKPGRIYLNNSNMSYAIHGEFKLKADIGAVRETFFANQVSPLHQVTTSDVGDFLIDGEHIFEIGGTGKTKKQIKDSAKAHLAIDGIEIGSGNKIPLYLFGFLY